jgi:ABC-2 type transport system permease protein
MTMHGVLGNEFLKMWGRWRSAIPFITIGIIVPLLLIGMKLGGGDLLAGALRRLPAAPGSAGANIVNGYLATILIMNGLWIHIPFLLTLVAGDQLAGEGAAGTFRILLTRPASRARVIGAKYLCALAYTAAVVAFTVALSLGLGILLFGTGALVIPWRAFLLLPEGAIPPRLLLSFLLAVWGMWSVTSLAFLFSSLVDNALGPIVGTMAVIIAFYALGTVPVDLFQALRPYLFTTYLPLWQKAFEATMPWEEIVRSCAILGAFSVGFYSVAWYIFERKDILS